MPGLKPKSTNNSKQSCGLFFFSIREYNIIMLTHGTCTSATWRHTCPRLDDNIRQTCPCAGGAELWRAAQFRRETYTSVRSNMYLITYFEVSFLSKKHRLHLKCKWEKRPKRQTKKKENGTLGRGSNSRPQTHKIANNLFGPAAFFFLFLEEKYRITHRYVHA